MSCGSCGIDAGSLRHRIEILRTTGGTADAYGEKPENQVSLGTFWASIEPISGRELWQAQQVQSDVTHRIIMRYQAGTKPQTADIVQYTDPDTTTVRRFEIDSVIVPMELRAAVQLMCIERNEVVA